MHRTQPLRSIFSSLRLQPPCLPLGVALAMFPAGAGSVAAAEAAVALPSARNPSLRNELQLAIDRGLRWLLPHQDTNGWWSTPDQPAISALTLTAFQGDPLERHRSGAGAAVVRRGYQYLLGCAQPDGGIHRSNLVTYNTALSMVALAAARDPGYDSLLRKSRQFLIRLQRDFDEPGKADTVFDGGIGYGSRYEHSDMGNTLAALEALHHTRALARSDSPRPSLAAPPQKDLDWAAAVQFLQNCQNLPSHNRQRWASDDPAHKGGFVYYPGHSMAGSETNGGRVALRSYGSISYAGLLSYVYADLRRDDPRVVAVFDWLRRNYTLQENPGMGPQGLYYYFHTMTKALTAYGAEELTVEGGGTIRWRQEVALRLLDLQQKDGSWINESGRWMEKDPVLVTSYALLALELIARGL